MQKNLGSSTMNYVELMEKRIDSAYTALNRCEQSGSEWGVNYWTKVVGALMRQLNYYMNAKH